jgi:2',3'-cyclic-nucleotide 2'-phosphodiesterase (5'-nucleotidase family)
MISNDYLIFRKLAQQVPEIDLILGGHDHVRVNIVDKNNIILKSGTDFRELTFNKVKLYNKSDIDTANLVDFESTENQTKSFLIKNDYVLSVETEFIEVTSNVPEDNEIASLVSFSNQKLEQSFKQIIGYLNNSVDARFCKIRSESSSLGNFIADIMGIYMNTDCSVINTGCLRIDSFINEGEIK